MTFSFKTILAGGLDANVLKNPIQSQLGALTSMTSGIGNIPSSLPEVATAMAQLNTLAATASAYVQAEMQILKTKLPMMAAASRLETAAQALDGKSVGTGATDLLAGATQGITNIGPLMQQAVAAVTGQFDQIGGLLAGVPGANPQAKLTAFAASVPPMQIPDPADPTGNTLIDNPAYLSFASTNAGTLSGLAGVSGNMTASIGGALTSLAGFQAADAAAATAGIGKLRDLAFANFCAQAQPPAVRDVLDKFTNRPTSDSYVEKQVMRSATTAQNQTIEQSGGEKYCRLPTARQPNDNASAATRQEQPQAKLTEAQLAEYKQVLVAASETLFTWKEQINAKWKAIGDWKAPRNYDAIKADAQANPNDAAKQSAYQALKDELINSDVFKDYDADSKAYNKALSRQKADIDRYNNARDGLIATLTAATETFGNIAMAVLK
jgi:hypothetical protein